MQTTSEQWQERTSPEIIEHLLTHYHEKLRMDLIEIRPLFDKVVRVHGDAHPELPKAFKVFGDLSDHLSNHLQKEEQVLFPTILEFESQGTDLPLSFFSGPISVMESDHTSDLQLLSDLEQLTLNFALPTSACRSYTTLYNRLSEVVSDIRAHIDLENGVLFPRYKGEGGCCGTCTCA